MWAIERRANMEKLLPRRSDAAATCGRAMNGRAKSNRLTQSTLDDAASETDCCFTAPGGYACLAAFFFRGDNSSQNV
jgi:hypothetical protein